MILINLLPHREAAKLRRKRDFNVAMFAAILAGVALAFLGYLWLQSQLADQAQRNQFLKTENTKLDETIKDVAGLEAEIQALIERQKAVEDLQADRNLPVQMINELVAYAPEGLYLRSLKQEGMAITMSGMAQSNERVSELLRRLNTESKTLVKPQLIEIVADKINISKTEQRPAFKFTVRALIQRPASEKADDPKGAASAGVKNG
ncbi:fimbrial protein [Comamonas serinivorans]|uniref:Fimbrial protein n=1 Tax=Comamonas serinivorans TaxID=1082851 RepID=A0A1Y0ERH8_9BURK|nr:PilN domain-containing protein [Comamonas serinivorans]ARU06001.1 fimbrial protein [Comamonas serinivorans]